MLLIYFVFISIVNYSYNSINKVATYLPFPNCFEGKKSWTLVFEIFLNLESKFRTKDKRMLWKLNTLGPVPLFRIRSNQDQIKFDPKNQIWSAGSKSQDQIKFDLFGSNLQDQIKFDFLDQIFDSRIKFDFFGSNIWFDPEDQI